MTSEYEIREIIARLSAANLANAPRGDEEELIQAYTFALRNYSPSALRRGVEISLRENKYFPTPAGLAEAAERVVGLFPSGHPLFVAPDEAQRFQDEIYGYARPLLTKDDNKWSPGQIAEFERLTGFKPRIPETKPRTYVIPQKFQGTGEPALNQDAPITKFRVRQQSLEDAWYQHGEYNANDWMRLIDDMTTAGFVEQASAARRKIAVFSVVEALV